MLSHNDHTAYELDPESGRVLHSFKAPEQPHEGTVSADGKMVFVAVPNGPIVAILDGESFKEVARIESPMFTRTPRLSPNAPAGTKPSTSASPHGIALNNDGSKLYVGLENADVPGIVVIDVKTRKILKKIELLLEGGHYLAIQPGTDKLYYPHRNDDRVVVLDTKTDRILKIIPVKGGPVGVAFAPNGEVWLHEDGDGSVTVVDGKTDEVKAVIPTGGTGAGRMAVSPDGKSAASTHGGTRRRRDHRHRLAQGRGERAARQGSRLPAVLTRQHEALCDEFRRRRRRRDRPGHQEGHRPPQGRRQPLRWRREDGSIGIGDQGSGIRDQAGIRD